MMGSGDIVKEEMRKDERRKIKTKTRGKMNESQFKKIIISMKKIKQRNIK